MFFPDKMIIPLLFPIAPDVTTAAPIFIATIRARELDLLWPAWQERARPTCLLLSISARVPTTSKVPEFFYLGLQIDKAPV